MWNLVISKEVYSQYVIFREVRGTSKNEYIEGEKPKKQEFEMNYESMDLGKLTEFDEEVEQQTMNIKRSS